MSASDGISTRLLGGVLRVMEAHHLDADALLDGANIDPKVARSTNGRVPYACVDTLIEHLCAHVAPAGLGLALAAAQEEAAYGPAGLLLLTAGSFRRGLQHSIGYQRLWGDGDRFNVENELEFCRVTFRHPGKSPLARAVFAECALGEIAAGARALVGPDASAIRVELAHESLRNEEELSAHFGVRPTYGARHNAIVFAPEVADRPLHLLRDVLSRAIEEQARRLLDGLPSTLALADRVRHALGTAIDRRASLGAIAKRLGMSGRTLQRRLSDEGTTFEHLRDAERRTRADALLREGAPLKQAALNVGFADPSALARARKRWTRRLDD